MVDVCELIYVEEDRQHFFTEGAFESGTRLGGGSLTIVWGTKDCLKLIQLLFPAFQDAVNLPMFKASLM